MRRASILITAIAGLLTIFVAVAPAQRTTATIYGTVQDPTGAVVPQARVSVTNEETGYRQSAETDAQGEFTVSFLPVGRYQIRVEAAGFKTFVQGGINLEAGQQFRYVASLELGVPTESVTVVGGAPLVENATTTSRYHYSSLQFTELPQGVRDFTSILALSTGFRPATQGMIQFDGLASGGASVTVDGVDASANTESSSTAMFQNFNLIKVVSMEAIEEVSLSRGVVSAEVGRTYSANINIITKRGTNDFHGSLFEAVQNDVFNAKSAMLRPGDRKAPVRLNQFGGSFSGPLKKDRLFFFAAYEGNRRSTTGISQAEVPTQDLRQRAIAAVPAYEQLLNVFPLPNIQLPNPNTGLFLGPSRNTAEDNHAVARVDYQLGASDLLTARYVRSRPISSGQRFPTLTFRDFHGIFESGTLTYMHSAPTWTGETRFNFKLDDTARLETLWEQGRIPAIEVQGVFSTQGEALFIRGHNYGIEQVFMKVAGRHAFKFGGAYNAKAPGRFDEEVPLIRYKNVSDFLANRPDRVQITFGTPNYHARVWDIGLFVQDDFRLRPSVMLNLGLRYEYYSVLDEKDGLLFNPDGPLGAVRKPPVFRPKGSAYEADRSNFLPRVGVVWGLDRDSRTVIRTGFGVTLAQPDLRNFASMMYTSPEIPFRFRFTGSDLTRLGLKYPVNNRDLLEIMRTTDVPRGYNIYEPKNRNPYAMHWTFDLQRQLTGTLALQTGYVGNKGLKILMPVLNNFPDRITGTRPFPEALDSEYDVGADFSWYHAWQTSLRKRFSGGLTFNVNYTWGKAMAIGTGDFWPGNNTRVQDMDNWRADKGPANFDVAHRFTADWVYELPLSRLAGVGGTARHLLEGWQVSGTLGAETGGVLDVAQRSNRDSSRPDYVGGDVYVKGDRFQFLNSAAFALVPTSRASGQTIRPGNVGKNAFRGPGSWLVSLGLAKNFTWKERFRLQIRAEGLNAFNHVNLGTPERDLTRATFGRILGVGDPRNIQLRARLSF
ncbi:MAG: carboxypeptidase regulatory-like domain-containing protein [Acidobacteriota bacterium]